MTNQSGGWREPLTPWQLVQRQFFKGKVPDVVAFSEKHSLDKAHVQKIFSGEESYFSPQMCRALAVETEMSERFFQNLNEQYRQKMAA